MELSITRTLPNVQTHIPSKPNALKKIGKVIKKIVTFVLHIFRSLLLLPIPLFESLILGSRINWFRSDKEAKRPENLPNHFRDTEFNLCPSTKESVAWKKRLVANAKHSIELSGSYCGGKPFAEILQAIEKNLESNKDLKVRILNCPGSPDYKNKQNHKLIRDLQMKYPKNFEMVITPAT